MEQEGNMTNQEAIEAIKLARSQVEWDYPMDYAAAFDKAIEALEQEPTTKSDVPENNVGKIEPTTKNDSSELEKNSKLEKIRDQLKSNLRGVEITLEVLVENDPLRPKMEGAKTTLEDCLELIDKVETEDT